MASEMSLHYYGKPLVCTYSGGKDSDVMLELFRRSGIPYEVHNSHTTADAPQTVWHIRETFRRLELVGIPCEIEMPTYQGERTSMWKLIPQKLMPIQRDIDLLQGQGVRPYRVFIYLLVTADLQDAAERVEALKKYKGINLYAQPERNERLGVIPNKMQLEFAQRYIYGGCYRTETWEEYCRRRGIK